MSPATPLSPLPRHRPLAAAGAAVVLVLSLGACSLSLSSQGGGSTPSSRAAEAEATEASSEASAAEESPTPQRTAAPAGPSTADPDERPGASVVITDSDWVSDEEYVDKTMACRNGPLLLDKDYEYVRVDGDCTTLTVSGDSVSAIVDYAETVVVNGSSIEVYVRDVNAVVVSGDYNTVVWAGSTPTVKDTGTGTETRAVKDD